jgi:hypothetical protein
MTELTFTKGQTSYQLKSDGSLVATTGGASTTGKWSAVSAAGENKLTLTTGTIVVSIDVTYSFDTSLARKTKNVLKLTIPASGTNAEASGLFPGTIDIDDSKDITYTLPEGGVLILYGALGFSADYRKMVVTFPTGGTAEISGDPPTISQGKVSSTKEGDLLRFAAVTRYPGLPNSDAKIGIFGSLEPTKEGSLVFLGSVSGQKSFDVTLAGTYKMGSFGLQVFSKDGSPGMLLAARGKFKHSGSTGEWSVALGYSAKEFKLDAKVALTKPATDKNGDATLNMGVKVLKGSSGFSAELVLDGTFQLAHNRKLQFMLKAGTVNGVGFIEFAGTLTVKDGATMSFTFATGEGGTSIGLAYTGEKLKVAIAIAKGDSGVGLSFFVSYTFTIGGEGKEEQKPGKAKSLPVPV